MRPTRRDLLRSLAGVAAFAKLSEARHITDRRVAIIGGGMAGMALAWLLEPQQGNVTLLEARGTVGGNVQSVDVEIGGESLSVDVGAQFFHPVPYPLYTALLVELGLYPPDPISAVGAHAFSASITLAGVNELLPRFVSPVLPGRAWPLLAGWNTDGIAAFATAFAAAKAREEQDASWALTLGDWLPTLGLTSQQWEGMILPWAASLFTGNIEQARGLSARAAMFFAAEVVPPNPLQPIQYFAIKPSMGEVLRRLREQSPTTQVFTDARVRYVVRDAQGTFHIGCDDGRTFVADDVVFAASGPATLRLLHGLADTGPDRAALRQIEFAWARLAIHGDPTYVSPNSNLWSFLNCHADGPFCEASMWMASVLGDGPASPAAGLWKSWATHRELPSQLFHQAVFLHMVPTPASLAGQAALRARQGRNGVWYAGGYLFPYDAQETALWSAVQVALGMGASSARSQRLLNETPATAALNDPRR
jgi:predicted NAD/FAD-binding protein